MKILMTKFNDSEGTEFVKLLELPLLQNFACLA